MADATLDWRLLAPAAEIHDCDCSYCQHQGQLEPVDWPPLTRTTIEYRPAITDRFMVLSARYAPIPDGYEGPVFDGPEIMRAPFLKAAVTDEPATGMHFRWQTIRAIELTGWRLRRLDPTGLSKHDQLKVAIVTPAGTRIGTAQASRFPVAAGTIGLAETREYVE